VRPEPCWRNVFYDVLTQLFGRLLMLHTFCEAAPFAGCTVMCTRFRNVQCSLLIARLHKWHPTLLLLLLLLSLLGRVAVVRGAAAYSHQTFP